MTNKAQDYYDNFLKEAIKSKKQLETFFKDKDVRKKFTESEITKMKNLWEGTPFEPVVEATLDASLEVMEKSEDILEKLTEYKFNDNNDSE